MLRQRFDVAPIYPVSKTANSSSPEEVLRTRL
jgi:hypothetical protein